MAAGDVIVVSESTSAKKGNYFDGTDDYVLHDAHAVARVAANDTTGTYTAWIYLDNLSSNMAILSAGDDNAATEYLLFEVSSGGILKCTVKHGGANQWRVQQNTGTITARTWTHVAIVQNGTQPVMYINGELLTDVTNQTATDLTYWYDELTGCDKFAIGVLESNATHTTDFTGAIGRVQYWYRALSAAEVLEAYRTNATTNLEYPDSTYLVFDVTMENNGTTDSGTGADNGTLTGHAHYGGLISSHTMAVERNSTGHAAEFINTQWEGGRAISLIKRGD